MYYVVLYKVTKTKFDKKTNTITKYLECVSQYSYTSKVEQYIATNIINAIGNGSFDLIPNDCNEFNKLVILNILRSIKHQQTKAGFSVRLTQVDKSYGDGPRIICLSGCS